MQDESRESKGLFIPPACCTTCPWASLISYLLQMLFIFLISGAGRERQYGEREQDKLQKAREGSAEKAAESVLCLKSCFGISQLFHKGFLFISGGMPSRREVKRSWLGCGGALVRPWLGR